MADSDFTLCQCPHCDCVRENSDTLDYHIYKDHPDISD